MGSIAITSSRFDDGLVFCSLLFFLLLLPLFFLILDLGFSFGGMGSWAEGGRVFLFVLSWGRLARDGGETAHMGPD